MCSLDVLPREVNNRRHVKNEMHRSVTVNLINSRSGNRIELCESLSTIGLKCGFFGNDVVKMVPSSKKCCDAFCLSLVPSSNKY